MADVGYERHQMKELMSQLEKQKGILKRKFEKNHTIVEQDAKNTCFYKLQQGKIRFEKRIVQKGVIKNVTLLGSLDETAEWTFFCELSAFGIQEKTSAAIVADSDDVVVTVVPVSSFDEFAENHAQFHVLFYKNITKRLAQMLRGLHSRTLNLSTVQETKSAQEIHNENVFFSWSGTVKSGFASKSEGHLLLSRSYVSFVKKKLADRSGIVAEATEMTNIVIPLKEITELSFMSDKITIRDAKTKLVVSLRSSSVGGDVVRDVISMARNSIEKAVSSPRRIEASGEGIAPLHLIELKEKFETVSYKPGELIQKANTKVKRIGYVLEGSVGVKILDSSGKEILLKDVQKNETVGDIGVFTDSPSSAELFAGAAGVTLLELPASFLFADSNYEFRVRIFFSLIQLMWHRIIRIEREQIQSWASKFS